jgi:DNA-binding transcriptional MerR regulator
MPPNKYTPSQVQNLLDLPPSTLRRYSQLFGGYLSEQARSGRKRYYSERDITVLAEIARLSGEGVRIADIPGQLDQVIDLSEPEEPEELDQQVTDLALPKILKGLNDFDRRLVQQKDDLEQLRADVQRLQSELEEQRRQAGQPWYKRLLGRKK